jgi:diguanylate cyclase (GGDEF)-like protein
MGIVVKLTKKNQLDTAALVMISLIFLMLVFLVFYGSGLRDTAIFGFPGIIIFSTMIGKPKLTYGLLAATIVTVMSLSAMHSAGWISEPKLRTSYVTGLEISIIIIVIGYAIIALHGDLVNASIALRDENERVTESEKQISHIAHHDSLTNLPNRILARDRFEHALASSIRNNRKVALLFLDLDDFKSVNDSLGHEAGDELLLVIAMRLKKTCRQQDTICRLGGDEFLIIAEDIQEDWQASHLADKILTTISKEIQLKSSLIHCSASIGIALSPSDGKTFEDILKKSDIAMYHSKNNGRNQFHYFDNEQQENLQHRIDLTKALKTAVANNEFHLLYQPKVCLDKKTFTGAEALIRWESPQFGFVSPVEFIPIAEQAGLINEIGLWVIQQACSDAPLFLEHDPNFQLSINVSVAQFRNNALLNDIQTELDKNQLNPHSIDIEITESLLADKEGIAQETLKSLRAFGLSISIDDFGTGYSNLGYLKHFDVETLKIDRSFIYDLENNEQNQTIVKAILQICSGLGMNSVAEGVEDEASIRLLESWGCDIGQGYYWSKPVSLDKVIALMQ